MSGTVDFTWVRSVNDAGEKRSKERGPKKWWWSTSSSSHAHTKLSSCHRVRRRLTMRVVGPDTHTPTHKRSSDYRWPPVGKFDSIHQCHTVCPVFHISRVVEVGVLQNFYPLIRCSSRRRMGPAVRVVGHLQAPKRINWFVIIRRRRRRQQQQVHHVAILLYKPISVQETSCSAFKMMIDHGTCWPPPDPSPRRLLAKRAIFCPPVNKSVQLKTYKCVNIDGKKRKKNEWSIADGRPYRPRNPPAFPVSSASQGGLLLIIKQVTSITIKVESLSASGCPWRTLSSNSSLPAPSGSWWPRYFARNLLFFCTQSTKRGGSTLRHPPKTKHAPSNRHTHVR